MKRDLHNLLQSGAGETAVGAVLSVAPQACDSAVTGSAADLKGYRSAEIVIQVGANESGDANTITIQESDDDSAYSAVAAADLRGGANAIAIDGDTTSTGAVYLRGYVGNSRYLRVLIGASATTGHIIGAEILRGHKMNRGQLNETA